MRRINSVSFSAALLALVVCAPLGGARADGQFDPSVDYRSLKEEFAAEDAGATYGDKRTYVVTREGEVRRRKPVKRKNFSASANRRD